MSREVRLSVLVMLMLLTPTCSKTDRKFRQKSMQPATSLNLATLERYESCEAFKEDLQKNLLSLLELRWKEAQYLKAFPPQYESSQADGISTGTASPTASSVTTNLQVAGVDEADDIKMNSQSIFIADNQLWQSNRDISIISKSPLRETGKISLTNFNSPQLYTFNNLLVVTGSEWGRFAIKVYDVTQKPVLKSEISLNSWPSGSRMLGGKLFVVLNERLQQKGYIPYPSTDDLNGTFEAFAGKLKVEDIYTVDQDSIGGIQCAKTMKLPLAGYEYNYQRILSYDIERGSILDELLIPDSDSGLYMTANNIYTYSHPVQRNVWINPSDGNARKLQSQLQAISSETLVIKKIGVDAATGQLLPKALGNVAGHLKQFGDRWAFNEIIREDKEYLSVVTTSGSIQTEATNQLIVLRQEQDKLTEASSIRNFGHNEDVRSVRYIADKAYVVTFKRTDPLFAIDLANPLTPKITGELKIPGFSMYMHPHAENRLLGVGYQTEESGETDINRAFFQGILLQMFDIANPEAPTRLDFVELGKRGSYSEANQEHKAFYYDAANKLAAIPVVLFDDGKVQTGNNGQNTQSTLNFSGAVFYRLLDQGLQEVKRESHLDFLGPNCLANLVPLSWTTAIVSNPEIRRIFRDGSTIYTISNFGVKTMDATSFVTQASLRLSKNDCFARPVNQGME